MVYTIVVYKDKQKYEIYANMEYNAFNVFNSITT